MKRTLERVTFMIIGALIACIAYFIGNTEYDVEAQDTDRLEVFDTIICRSLIVQGGNVDDMPKRSGTITFTVGDNGEAEFAILTADGNRSGAIIMKTDDESARIMLNTKNRIEYKEPGEQPGITFGVFKNDASMVVENKTLISEKRELK
ncbi:hypothetical protein F4Y93_08110 [Candidatus Poribacteria bacterium]|nr:hypothetical protein [Candidatus Poribacteria bacterium]